MESSSTKLLVVRHGITEWNRAGLAQGTADIDLDEEGREQADAVADRLASFEIDAVFSSDLKRAVQTAEPIAARHGLKVVQDPDFREVDQGEWTGLTTREIRRRWPDLWGPARHYSARPGGESPGGVRRRMLRGITRVARDHPRETVVIVSHGAAIRWLSAEALGYDDRHAARIRGLSNGGVVTMDARIEGDRVVVGNLVRLDGGTPDLDDPNA
ncbi:MAG: histidine phosphatase family protein [Actinobacteria bacterium]|nr:histidine phosphatase family protein [Actinomycetota bacterium]